MVTEDVLVRVRENVGPEQGKKDAEEQRQRIRLREMHGPPEFTGRLVVSTMRTVRITTLVRIGLSIWRGRVW